MAHISISIDKQIMSQRRICIVVPAFNEAETIVSVVTRSLPFGVTIVVDDGSSDETGKLAEKAGAIVVLHNVNRGYDQALNSGFAHASELGFEYVVTLDADGQHDPSLIQKFIDAIDAGADVVIGIRSQRQRLVEHLFAWYTNIRFGIKDPLCGMKTYRTMVYKALGHFDSYGSIGTELMTFAAKNGCQISQIPFDVQERKGQSRFGQVLAGNYKIGRAMILSICRVK